MPDNENKKPVLTLKQVLPVCGVAYDELIHLDVRTDDGSTMLDVHKDQIPKVVSGDILNGTVSLILANHTNSLTVTVHAASKLDDKKEGGANDRS